MATLTAVFATFSYFPPKVFLFENFFCYQYTGEYGILDDYGPYRVFVKMDADGVTQGWRRRELLRRQATRHSGRQRNHRQRRPLRHSGDSF